MTAAGVITLLFLLASCHSGGRGWGEIRDIGALDRDSLDSVAALTDSSRLSERGRMMWTLARARRHHEPQTAEEELKAAAAYFSTQGDSVHLAHAYYELAAVASVGENSVLASAYLNLASAVYPRRDSFYVFICQSQGFAGESNGDHHAAAAALQTALSTAIHNGDDVRAAFILFILPQMMLREDSVCPDSVIYYVNLLRQPRFYSHSIFPPVINDNIATALMLEERYAEALEWTRKRDERMNMKGFRSDFIRAEIFFRQGKRDSLRQPVENIMRRGLFRDPSDCNNIARYLLALGRPAAAAAMYRRSAELSDSLFRQRTAAGRQNVTVLLRAAEDRERQWREREAQQHTLYNMLFALAALVLFSTALVFLHLRQRDRHRAAMAEKEAQRLAAEAHLREKETERLAAVASLAEQREREARLRESFFRQLNTFAIESGGSPRLSDGQWQTLFANADAAFDGFTRRLTERYPLLNSDDLRYCVLVKMGLTQADIATVMCRERGSVKKRIRRIVLDKMSGSEGTLLADMI